MDGVVLEKVMVYSYIYNQAEYYTQTGQNKWFLTSFYWKSHNIIFYKFKAKLNLLDKVSNDFSHDIIAFSDCL